MAQTGEGPPRRAVEASAPVRRDASGRLDFGSLDKAGIRALVQGMGKERYRALQAYKWVWQKRVRTFGEMTDISKEFRRELAERAFIPRLELVREDRAADGTLKYLWELHDGARVESVLIPEPSRLTLCLSSQVGCALGCRFCITGDLGFRRNLLPSEMALQPLQVQERLPEGQRISNLVFMGMGEPLLNRENLQVALGILLDENALNFSHRKITVSTAGVVPELERLARSSPVNLAVSLNASHDEQRSAIMPVNRRWNLHDLVETCRRLPLPAGKRITFEYVMLGGFNDTRADADRLVRLLRGVRAKVNLIPYNANPQRPFERPADDRVKAFQDRVIRQGVQCSIRNSRGLDIAAACGQLAAGPRGGEHGDRSPSPVE